MNSIELLKQKIDQLKQQDDGTLTEAISYFDSALSITKQYEFDMEGGIDLCLIPNNSRGAFELFKRTGGLFQLELNKAIFLLLNQGWDEDAIKQTLREMDRFKENSLGLSYLSATASVDDRDEESEIAWLQEYRCLTGDFYEKHNMEEIGLLSFRSRVYGEYVLFSNFLKQKYNDILAGLLILSPSNNSSPTKMQIALFYYYLQKVGIQDRFENNKQGKIKAIQEITEKYGYTSWKRFQEQYNKISSHDGEALRTKGGKRNLKNLEVVITMLKQYPEALFWAEQDLKKAQSRF